MQDKKDINKKVIDLINSKSPQEAITELLEWQTQSVTQQIKFWIRQPILYILQNQHDWQNILKCLKKWRGLQKFQRGFHERMKNRVLEEFQKNISQRDIKNQLLNLVQKYFSMYEKKKPLIIGIQSYFQHEKLQEKKIDPNQMKNDEKTKDKGQQNLTQKTEPQKSNSISSHGSKQNVKQILRKPTLGMLTKKQPNASGFDKPQHRNLKRLTFGMVQTSKNNIKGLLETDKNLQQIKQNKDQTNIKKKDQKKPQQEIQIDRKYEQPKIKQNIFQKKQEIVQRVNPIFKTEKKETQQTIQNKQKSCSKIITPHKNLIQRKKIIIKKASQYTNTIDEDFISAVKYDSSFQDEEQLRDFSQGKQSRYIQILNCEQQQLKKQIQKQDKQMHQSFQKQTGLRKPQKSQGKEYMKKNIFGKRQDHPIITHRKQNQLFSDTQLSLLNLNLTENKETQVNIHRITNKYKGNSYKKITDIFKQQISSLRSKRLNAV